MHANASLMLPGSSARRWRRRLPGVLLCAAVVLLALLLQELVRRCWGPGLLEALVLTILLGALLRSGRWVPRRCLPGIGFCAKPVLELAIVLLGASVDFPALLSAGPRMLLAIALVVVLSILASHALGRALGLKPRLALLVACGNSICGNSAIAAVAPVIEADSEEVVTAIAMTAVLGVAVVLLLPLLIGLLDLSFYQYGVLAGMTVYAVPQVLAATFPVSVLSGQIGTLVKLVRVLFLGPVVCFLALRYPRANPGRRPGWKRLIPWFILGFLMVGLLRSTGLLAPAITGPMLEVSHVLTLMAMAALGLEVDVRRLRGVGLRVSLAVLGSLAFIMTLSLLLIGLFGLHGDPAVP